MTPATAHGIGLLLHAFALMVGLAAVRAVLNLAVVAVLLFVAGSIFWQAAP